MTYEELIKGYHRLYERLLHNRNIAERIKNKIRYLTSPSDQEKAVSNERMDTVRRFILQGLLPGGFSRIFHFLRTFPFSKPQLIPLVIQDWIIGLSMRDYFERHFVLEFEKANQLTHSYLGTIEKAFERHIQRGVLEISLSQVKHAAANLSLTLKGISDRKFFPRAARHLERILQDTSSSITLHIGELQETHVRHLNRLLKRLSQYGDRIHISINEKLRPLVEIDSSVFNLVLVEVPRN
jgi:hypothetical protein